MIFNVSFGRFVLSKKTILLFFNGHKTATEVSNELSIFRNNLAHDHREK